MSLNSSQSGVIVLGFLLPALAFMLFVPLSMINATTGAGTSEDIPTGVNDPTLSPGSAPDISNTTSEDIPTGVNDPTLSPGSAPDISNTTSEDIPTGVNDPTALLPTS